MDNPHLIHRIRILERQVAELEKAIHLFNEEMNVIAQIHQVFATTILKLDRRTNPHGTTNPGRPH